MGLLKKIISIGFLLAINIGQGQVIGTAIIPGPKEIKLNKENLCVSKNYSFYSEDPEAYNLYEVLQQEFLTLAGVKLSKGVNKSNSTFFVAIDNSLKKEEYKIEIDKNINITGGSYNALVMASATVLQSMEINKNSLCWSKGSIKDSPDFNFRAMLLDVARNKHDVATIKRIIVLCRWYKINHLQLHLTDGNAFTFPSQIYPQLPTQGWAYTIEEIKDLIAFADKRGIQIIPELEVPGHAGQLIQKMPEVFGFKNEKLNLHTVHMGRERVYEVLDKLIGEIAEVFHSSEYIHIGSDEINFRGMEEDVEINEFIQEKGLKNIEELYWYFINRMNRSVKKAGRKTIVWEGFSKEGNNVIDKDITVMAWESMYQLPQDILEAGYTTINVSWKPLYVVNNRKWDPKEIFDWNIYKWDNFHPNAPSYKKIQLDEHPGIIGAMMASWEQPQYVELSSLRKRVPAMIEETWNHSQKPKFETFKNNLEKTDHKLTALLTPVKINVEGLTHSDIEDGRNNEQTWFGNKVVVDLSQDRGLDIRYSLDSTAITHLSPKYTKPLTINKSTELRYRAFQKENPVGMEMLQYFEQSPLKVDLTGDFSIPIDKLWETLQPHTVKYQDSVEIKINSNMEGEIRYVIGDSKLDSNSALYTSPIIIKDNSSVKAGLFKNGRLIGNTWSKKFINQ